MLPLHIVVTAMITGDPQNWKCNKFFNYGTGNKIRFVKQTKVFNYGTGNVILLYSNIPKYTGILGILGIAYCNV